MDHAKNGAPLRLRHDLSQPHGMRAALSEVYPPDEAAEANFDQLLGRLSNEPSAHGVKSALHKVYPPTLDAEAGFDRLLGNLRDQPGSNVKGAGDASH